MYHPYILPTTTHYYPYTHHTHIGIVALTDDIVKSSIEVFSTIIIELLPTPSKSHYTFNLRDLAKVFQGMLMADVKKMNTKEQLARLWVHECQRVFGDRLTCEEDHHWLVDLLNSHITTPNLS